MERNRYPTGCFKRHKTAKFTGLRLCYEYKNYLQAVVSHPGKAQKAYTSLLKYIERVDSILRGEHPLGGRPETFQDMAEALTSEGFLNFTLSNMSKLDFESTKSAFSFITRLILH